jgi:hypothetical protein
MLPTSSIFYIVMWTRDALQMFSRLNGSQHSDAVIR